MEKYIKAREYFFNRIKNCSDPETFKTDLECAINDAANIFANSREEYQKIYDMLNNLNFSVWY